MVHWVIITLNSSFYSNRNFDLKDASISERARTHFLFWSYIMWFVIFMLPDWWCVLMCYFSYSSWASRRFLHMWYMALVLSLLGGSYQRLFQHLIPFPWSAVTKFCVNTQSFAWLKYLWLIVIMSAAPKNSGNRGPWVHHLVRHTVSPFQGMRLINQESLLKLLVVGSTINHLLVNTVCSMLRLLIYVFTMCRKTEMSCSSKSRISRRELLDPVMNDELERDWALVPFTVW